MVTIKDIAKAAGVSHGTASNVLNKRGNVSSTKIKLVEEAASRLGYQLNSQAQILRKGSSKTVCVLLPIQSKSHYRELVDTFLSKNFDQYDIQVAYVSGQYDLDTRIAKLLAFLPLAIVCVGMVPSQKSQFVEKETKLIVLDVYSNDKVAIKFDIEQLKQIVIGHIQKISPKRVAILKPYHSCSLMDKTIEALHSLPVVIDVLSDENIVQTFFEMTDLTPNDVIYLMSEQVAQELRKLYDWFEKEIPHIVVIGGKSLVAQKGVTVISLDYKQMSELLLQSLATKLNKVIPVMVEKGYTSYQFEKSANKLTILTIESPMSKALKRLMIKYEQITATKIEIIEKAYDDLLNCLYEKDVLEKVDLIRVDMAWLPNVAKSIFRDLTNDNQAIEINEKLFPNIAKEYSFFNDKQYTFPLDISSQVLIYRKDLFEDVLVQRQFFEKYKQQLTVPTSYAMFDKISEFFTKSCYSDSKTEYGHTLALKTPIVATCDFMPRYREALRHNRMNLSQLSEVVLQYQRSFRFTNQSIDCWWGDLVNHLQSGKTAMEIVFSNYVSPLFSEFLNTSTYQFGIAQVPGKQPMIGGGAIGVSRFSKKHQESLQLLDWLYSPEVAKLLAYLGGALPVESVVRDSDLKMMYPWFNDFEETFKIGSRTKWYNFETNLDFENLLGQELIEIFTCSRN